MKLHELAHARSGDKGSTADISVIAYTPSTYPHLRTHLTPDRVRAHFPDLPRARSTATNSRPSTP